MNDFKNKEEMIRHLLTLEKGSRGDFWKIQDIYNYYYNQWCIYDHHINTLLKYWNVFENKKITLNGKEVIGAGDAISELYKKAKFCQEMCSVCCDVSTKNLNNRGLLK